jgi:hypothetical protein
LTLLYVLFDNEEIGITTRSPICSTRASTPTSIDIFIRSLSVTCYSSIIMSAGLAFPFRVSHTEDIRRLVSDGIRWDGNALGTNPAVLI